MGAANTQDQDWTLQGPSSFLVSGQRRVMQRMEPTGMVTQHATNPRICPQNPEEKYLSAWSKLYI